MDDARYVTRMERYEAYYRAYSAAATRLKTRVIARQWCDMQPQPTPDEAALWASAGYLPEEAAPLIAQGITPELAADGDDALVDEHGVIGAGVLKLQLEHPGAVVVVDPDVEEPQ